MPKILVTGATGNIGRKTLLRLLERLPADEVAGLARDPERAADLAALGIEIRRGDYLDVDSLVHAFAGVEKLLLVSATAFGDRYVQHRNAIDAARRAGVRHIVFMPVIRKEGSGLVLPQVTEQDIDAEEAIKASGMEFTIVRHPPFLENIWFYFGDRLLEFGLHAPAGLGKAAFASRDDLAEAHAVVLTESGHANRTYSLYGGPAVSFADVARILSDIGGEPVPFVTVTDEDFVKNLMEAGLPEPAARFVLAWVHGINGGEWDGASGDLERLLGRKPATASDFLRASYPAHRA